MVPLAFSTTVVFAFLNDLDRVAGLVLLYRKYTGEVCITEEGFSDGNAITVPNKSNALRLSVTIGKDSTPAAALQTIASEVLPELVLSPKIK